MRLPAVRVQRQLSLFRGGGGKKEFFFPLFLKRTEKRKKNGIENGVRRYGKIRDAPDPGRLRRRRRFQTSKPWLLFLAFSTYLTRIASPGPMLDIIQIVNFRSSSTPVNNENQHGSQTSKHEGNAGTDFDLTPQIISFLKRGRKDSMNIPSSNERGG
jgi:hypothetical protein